MRKSQSFERATNLERAHRLLNVGNHRTERPREMMRTIADQMGVERRGESAQGLIAGQIFADLRGTGRPKTIEAGAVG